MAAALAGAAFLVALGGGTGSAQDAMPEAAPAQQDPQAAAAQAPADAGGDRIGRLEQQISELQAMVAALTTLVKSKPDATLPQESGAAPVAAAGADPGLTARVDALETQLGALTGQIEILTQQMGAVDTRGGGEAPPAASEPPPPPQDEAPIPMEPPGRQGEAPADPDAGQFASAAGGDMASTGATPQRVAALAAGADAATLYNQGYGDLLRRDYASAEVAFRQLAANYPSDKLASKAQYWLGETYFVRGQFKEAADAFLKSYNAQKTGEKAPDSLVKLGMALGELGQKDAACASLGEFKRGFPAADAVLREQARSERVRLGC